PIIATSVGGNVEIIAHRKTGLLIKPRDVDALLSTMETLRKDTTLRKKLGDKARAQYVKKFDFDNIVKQHIIPVYKGMDI
ncbi:MAG: glycosyltransferase, partial [Candidatus Saccharimonadaceae bacterium]|nr:glycosyltransferase [Candidatus Saccharimonadaceae bacterium]